MGTCIPLASEDGPRWTGGDDRPDVCSLIRSCFSEAVYLEKHSSLPGKSSDLAVAPPGRYRLTMARECEGWRGLVMSRCWRGSCMTALAVVQCLPSV